MKFADGDTVMKRIRVAREGMFAPNGAFIEHGALSVKEDQLPVMFSYSWDELLGYAENMERDAEGWISFEITVKADAVPDWDMFDGSAYAGDIIWARPSENAPYHILTGVLKAVYLTPIAAFPKGAVFKDE